MSAVLSEKANNSKPNKKKSLPREGTAKDLIIGLSYFLFIVAVLGYGVAHLYNWKTEIDGIPPASCYDPSWSNQGNNLAFLQDQSELLKSEQDKCSLWTVNQSSIKYPQVIVKDLDKSYKIIGWFNEDNTIILKSKKSKESNLSLMVVNINDRKLNKFSFNDPTIEVVGHTSKEIYLQRPLHNTKTNSDELELLTWSTNNPQLTKITSIPNRPTVTVKIDSVVANKDSSKLAIAIHSVEKTSLKSLKAAPPATPQGAKKSELESSTTEKSLDKTETSPQCSAWVLDRASKRLEWTKFVTIDPDGLDLAWSQDSSWLTCVANFGGYSDVAIYREFEDLHTVRLRTYTNEGSLIPQIVSNQKRLRLISNQRIIEYDIEANTSNILADSNSFGQIYPSALIMADNSDSLAIYSNIDSSSQIYISTLSNLNPQQINVGGQDYRGNFLYDLASAIQCAVQAWN